MKMRGNEKGKWRISYHESVAKIDIPRLPKNESLRIRSVIENKLARDPVLYGLPLRATLKRYWKLRVGDYRIVYAIVKSEVRILVVAHRRDVYKVAGKRA